MLYQKGIFDPIVIAGETMTGMEIRQNRNASQTVLDIMILDRAEGISLRLEYIETLYERESMERFGKLLARIIQEITEAVTEHKNPIFLQDPRGLGRRGEVIHLSSLRSCSEACGCGPGKR